MVNISKEVAQNLLAIIDMGAKAGAYTGNNLTAVGQVRSELERALVEVVQAEQQATQATEQ